VIFFLEDSAEGKENGDILGLAYSLVDVTAFGEGGAVIVTALENLRAFRKQINSVERYYDD